MWMDVCLIAKNYVSANKADAYSLFFFKKKFMGFSSKQWNEAHLTEFVQSNYWTNKHSCQESWQNNVTSVKISNKVKSQLIGEGV